MLPDFRVRQRDYLLEIARALAEELDPGKLLSRILRISIEMLAGQAGLIATHEKPAGWAINVSEGIPQPLLDYLDTWIKKIPEDSSTEEEQIPEINRILQEISMGLLNGVGLPLIAQKKVIGIIYIFRNYPGMFSSNDRSLLSSFASQAAIAVRNARLYTEAYTEKQRMDALLDSAADGILIFTPDRVIERCNPAFARMLGSTPAEIQGKTYQDVIKWAKPPQGISIEEAEAGGWSSALHTQMYVEGDLLRLNYPHPLPINITYAPLLSPEGNVLNIIATVRDITRFRQAEELKSTFVSIVSHELKTPVALIKGYVSTLRRDDVSWERDIVQASLEVIEEEADRLTEMIENLLDASRLQAGGFSIKRSDISLPDLIRRLANRFQTQMQTHQIQVDLPQDFPIILGDEDRLAQVLTNLISNAIKYAPAGQIIIAGEVLPQQVIIRVKDEGPGIAPGDLPHIFERFYRAPDASRNTKGAGLGLYLARAIIEAHGGSIWVDRKQQKGASVCFSLPRE